MTATGLRLTTSLHTDGVLDMPPCQSYWSALKRPPNRQSASNCASFLLTMKDDSLRMPHFPKFSMHLSLPHHKSGPRCSQRLVCQLSRSVSKPGQAWRDPHTDLTGCEGNMTGATWCTLFVRQSRSDAQHILIDMMIYDITCWRQTPRSPTPKEHSKRISYTCHQRRNENTGYTQGFWLLFFGDLGF